MANIVIKDGAGNTKYLKAAGAGTDIDPHVPEQAVTVTGVATAANQATANSALADILAALASVAVTGPLTDAQLRANPILTTLGTLPDTAAGDLAAIAAALAGTLTVDGAVTIGSALPAGSANIGDVDVASVSLPAAIYNGKTTVTTAGTRVALASSQALVSGVTVKALAANTGTIYVGNSSVAAANGFALAKGESVFLEIANLATVYLDSSVNGEGATFVAS